MVLSYARIDAGKHSVIFSITALHQLLTVKYIRANRLLQESEKARDEGNTYDYTNEMDSYDLLVNDDFALMDLDMDRCLSLFKIIESKNWRKTTVIVSQLPVIK